MIFEDVVAHAWRAVKGHRQRSFLTMLGVIIGVAAVVSMLMMRPRPQGMVTSLAWSTSAKGRSAR